MTRDERLKGLSLHIQYLRERIASADEECPLTIEENELLRLEEKRDALEAGTARKK